MQGEEKITSNELLDLNKKKIELVNKLNELEEKKKEMRSNPEQVNEIAASAPPSEEEVSIRVVPNIEAQYCEMLIKLEKPGWIIRSVLLFSDTLFSGGSFAVHLSESSNQAKVPIKHSKSTAESMDIRLLIGAGINAQFFVCH